jgi:hypothetical protein
MHAMLIDGLPKRLDALQLAFLEAGIHVTGSGSLQVAECCLRRAVVDMLIVNELSCGDRLSDVVLLAQRRSPKLVTILLTHDVAAATDRYSDAFSSLTCVLEDSADPRLVAGMARASRAGRAACHVTGAPAVPSAPPHTPSPTETRETPDMPVFQTSRRVQSDANIDRRPDRQSLAYA